MIPLDQFPEITSVATELRELNLRYDKRAMPCQKRHGFKDIAHKYHLAKLLQKQLEAYQRRELPEDQLTTTKELADFFRVHRSSVQRYLKDNLTEEELTYRETILRQIGGRKGGRHPKK